MDFAVFLIQTSDHSHRYHLLGAFFFFVIGTRFSWSYRCQLVEACKELVEGHDQLLRRALGRQAGEALDVGEQDAAETQKNTRKTQPQSA